MVFEQSQFGRELMPLMLRKIRMMTVLVNICAPDQMTFILFGRLQLYALVFLGASQWLHIKGLSDSHMLQSP